MKESHLDEIQRLIKEYLERHGIRDAYYIHRVGDRLKVGVKK